MDLAFLAAYALGMFVAGHIGDRTDLRIFLAWGMLLSGLFTSLVGMVGWVAVSCFGCLRRVLALVSCCLLVTGGVGVEAGAALHAAQRPVHLTGRYGGLGGWSAAFT